MNKTGSCSINSIDIQCFDEMGNMTEMSATNYADNGAVCMNMSCPHGQKKLMRICTNGTWSGEGAWCAQDGEYTNR